MKKIIAVFSVMTLCAILLVACTPKEETLKAKFESEGYTVVSMTPEVYKENFGEIAGDKEFNDVYVNPDKLELEYVLMVNLIGNNSLKATVYAFKKASDATKFYNSLGEMAETNDNFDRKKKGSAVICGHIQIVNAFMK